MGAGRWRLVRQLLTERLILSLIGGTLGSALASWSFPRLTAFVTSHLPHSVPTVAVNVTPNLHVLAYAFGLTLLTGIAFGIVPAWRDSRLNLNTILKGDGAHAGSERTSGRFLLNSLIGSQVVVCMVLLLSSGLLLRGLYYAQTVDPGFDDKNVAQVFLNLREQGYDESRSTAFVQALRQRVEGFPGVVEVAQAECAPLSHDFSAGTFTVPGGTEKVSVEYNHISPEYFSVVGIPIVRGRGFTRADLHGPAIIVTESTARRLWAGEDPLGKTLREDTGRDDFVIGVAKDAQVSHLGELNTTYLYFPAGPRDDVRTYVLVRYAGNFAGIAKSIREAARSLDPDISVEPIRLADNLEVWRIPSRIVAALSGALGALALLLAIIGLYGMVSYSVSRCVREIGIRMALGADKTAVMKLVLWQAMRPVLVGSLLGIGLSAAVSQILSSMLFGVSAHDPIAFIGVPLLLSIVAFIASYIPARRVMEVDPMVALRCE
jgi:predicted permease